MKSIHVVAAVILDEHDNVLIARRPDDKHMGGLWEFPGGKVEAGEPVTDALSRELDEELGIQPTAWEPLIRIHHSYPDKTVLLDVWTVTAFTGHAHGREGQLVRWVSKSELSSYEFPEANKPILSAALLPNRYGITGSYNGLEELARRVTNGLDQGMDMICFRAPWLSSDEYREHLEYLIPLFSGTPLKLIVKGSLELLKEDGIDGLHLTFAQLEELDRKGWRIEREAVPDGKILIASCHNSAQLEMAARIGVTCATLSPVLATDSHPDAKPLGWEATHALLERATVPVYCLGGLGENNLNQCVQAGAQGVASIRDWWNI
ncbi:Nudix family hydrolase [Parendozoicomonas haliclonae]|uniref:8-oxo-dGTP diphosphatase n=1 Tax=Parendozoicomonas haliclonae TaxID=1960125 RepID=A0A1X7AEY0_9GAMM|nr:Nudix family hydrolase [Parendozoicomonas haliclonae]SMA34349.1 8-oxo-dGTP diphosphatase [Parendozoicomonas haliclonae]